MNIDITGVSKTKLSKSTTSDTWNYYPQNLHNGTVTIQDDEITGLTLASDEPTALGSATHFTASITGGTNVSYTWNFGDGTPPVTTDLVANTTHTYANAGNYTVIVIATNNHATSPKTDSLSPVRVHDPIKNLTADNDSPTVLGNATHFSATITSDPTGVTYAWDFGDGSGTGAGANPNYTYLAAGNYTARVTATNAVSTAVATTPVTITNQAPVADAGTDQDVDVDAAVQLDGSGSSDPDGHVPLTYGWEQTGGTGVALSDASIVNPTFTAPTTPAVLTFTLTVTDTHGLADATPDEVVVTVNEIGIVGLTASNDSPTALDQVTNFSALITAGSNVAYSWDFGDGIGTDTGANPNYTYLAAGNYTARVTATNSVSTVVETTPVTITNQAPVANAGPDQNPLVDTVVTLDGSGSSDPDGHVPLTYGWQQTGGPAVTLSDANAMQPTFTAPTTPAVLTFALTVTDTYGLASTPDEVVITVYNTPPVADAGPDQSPLVDTVVTLDGSGSSDPDGHVPLTYGWQQTGGPAVTLSNASAVNPTFTAPTTPAVLTFALTVTDTYGLADATPDEVVITVENHAPVADAGPDQSPLVDTVVTLDGSGSSDPDGHVPLTYGWQQTGGPGVTLSDASAVNPTFDAPTTPAVLTFALTVTDTYGLADATPDEVVITVENHAPVADAGPDQNPLVDTVVTLDGSGSSDPDGHVPLTYGWQQTGGPDVTLSDASAVNPTFTAPTTPAVLIFTLTVTDTYGLASTPDEVVITVYNTPPVADAGPDQNPLVDTVVTLDGSGSSDLDGHVPLTYGWQQTGGPAVTLSDANAMQPTFTAPTTPAVLTFALTVTDTYGLASTPDEVVITVYAPMPTVDFSSATYSVDEGAGTARITVTLDIPTWQNVTVNYATSDGTAMAPGDYTAISGTLIFAPGDVSETFDVTINDDALDEPDKTVTLTLSNANNAILGVTNNPATLTITDNDTAGVTVTPTTVNVTEGGATAVYSVTLDTQPTDVVTITIATDGQTTVNPTELVFDDTNWNTVQHVTVTAVDDAAIEGPHTSTINHTAASDDANYAGIAIDDVTANITDNDAAGVSVTPPTVNVEEGGATATYDVVLNTQPTDAVTITIATDGQTTVNPTELVFNDTNWDTAQQVTVTAVDDDVMEGAHSSTINHTATSDDASYDGIAIDDVTANITDNDTAGVTVTPTTVDVEEGGATDTYDVVLDTQPTDAVTITITTDGQTTVNPTELVFNDTNWDTAQQVTVTAVDDDVMEGAHSSTINHTATSDDANYDGIAIDDVTANITDNDTAGVTVTPTTVDVEEGGATDTYDVVLDTQPTDAVTITITTDGQTTVNPTELVFDDTNWDTAQQVTVTAVDDDVVEGPHTGTINHTATSDDANYAGIAIDDVTANITDNDDVGVTVTPTTVDVEEGGATAVYSVTLDTQPTDGVTITIATDGQTTVNPTELVFDDTNWDTAQQVTVTAVDDDVVEGAHSSTISHTATSDDANYDGIAIDDVTANITDNDYSIFLPLVARNYGP